MRISLARTLVVLAPLAMLGACATSQTPQAAAPQLVLPTDQHPLRSETTTRTLSLRVNAGGLSENQRLALAQVADEASWTTGDPVDIEIVTAGEPGAVSAGRKVSDYLTAHDVPYEAVSQSSRADHPADIITVNVTYTSAVVQTCNQTWENLAATRNNTTYGNFGCAVHANLAAQIADPRDIGTPARATSADALRKSEILGKYRKGEVTSAAKDEQAQGTISDAVQ